MDDVSTTGEAQRDALRSRRRRMRQQARSHRAPGASRFQTPRWLEPSFELPLTKPEANDVTSPEVPTQSVPSHDDVPDHIRRVLDGYADSRTEIPTQPLVQPPTETLSASTPEFVRPTSEEIDFARVVKRADLARQVTRIHWLALGLGGLGLLVYLLAPAGALLGMVIGLALVAAGTFAARLWLRHAPVPRLQR
jgi:hypothetical protein